MARPKWLRIPLFAVMALIAVLACGLAWERQRRMTMEREQIAAQRARLDAEIMLASSEYVRALDRAEWSNRMSKTGRISAAQVNSDRAAVEAARLNLQNAQKRLRSVDRRQQSVGAEPRKRG